MQTRTYQTLFNLVKSLAGVNSFTTEEEGYILNFTNRRFKEAYDSSEFWGRYLVVGESRTINSSNVVPFTESSKTTIGDFLRIHRTEPFQRQSAIEYDFYVTESGAHVMNPVGSTSSAVFVTYKKQVPEITVESNIPLEFYYFIAHAVYADFLRMDGQTEKAILEEQIAKGFLDDELGKLDNIYNNNSIGKKISTYVNRSSR